jgi:flavodoxin
MKILLVYYTYTGNTEKIALAIKDLIEKETTVHTVKIEPEKDLAYFLKSTYSLFGRTPAVKNDNIQNGYDYVVLGFPVWAFSPSAYFNSILDLLEFEKGNLILFCSCAGSLFERALNKAKKRAEKKGFTVVFTEAFKEGEDNREKVKRIAEVLR